MKVNGKVKTIYLMMKYIQGNLRKKGKQIRIYKL